MRAHVVAVYELRRGLRKKSFYAILALLVAPLAIALYGHWALSNIVAKNRLITQAIIEQFHLDRLWAAILGVEQPPFGVVAVAPFLLAMQTVSLSGLAWLVAILYGGDLLASDLRDKLTHLILVRPVSRIGYLAAKVGAVAGLISMLYAAAGVVAFISGWILVGVQKGVEEAIAFSLVIALGTLPLLLTSAALGAAARSPTIGFILGIVVYFAAAIASSLAAILAVGLPTPEKLPEIQRLTIIASAANPFEAGGALARALYAIIHSDGVMRVPISYAGGASNATNASLLVGASVVEVNAWEVAGIAALSLTLSTLAMLALLWLLVARRDL